MKVIFRTDASHLIGTGHVMRCLTLSNVLREQGYEIFFCCRPHRGNLISHIETAGFPVFSLTAPHLNYDYGLSHSSWLGATQEEDASQCINALEDGYFDWVIVDHYALDKNWEKKLKPHCSKLMVIDDIADREHICEFLLDQNYGTTPEKYKQLVPKKCKVLAGSEYAVLRPEFVMWRKYSLERREKPILLNLLISLGGVDATNLTAKLIDLLPMCSLPEEIKVTVVMGSTAPHLDSVNKSADACKYKISVKAGISNMAELMANADLAIGAAGSTTWERCCLGLPTIQLVLAENQIEVAALLEERMAVFSIGLKDTGLNEIGKIFRNIQRNPLLLNKVSKNCRSICDGLGSKRLITNLQLGTN